MGALEGSDWELIGENFKIMSNEFVKLLGFILSYICKLCGLLRDCVFFR